MMMHSPAPARGFSLIESVIIFGIIALVLGGIWVATAQVRQNQRINDAVSTLLSASQSMRSIWQPYMYQRVPSSNILMTTVAVNAGAFPGGRLISSNQEVLMPYGMSFRVTHGCYSICPMLSIVLHGSAIAVRQSRVTGAECAQIIRRFAGLAKDRTDFMYIQTTVAGNSGYQMLHAPIDTNAIDCPDNFESVSFWFTP